MQRHYYTADSSVWHYSQNKETCRRALPHITPGVKIGSWPVISFFLFSSANAFLFQFHFNAFLINNLYTPSSFVALLIYYGYKDDLFLQIRGI
jgi:hypothetical protein